MRIFFVILLMICFHYQGIAQGFGTNKYKYKAIYEMTYQPDSTDNRSVRKEHVLLYIGDQFSRFSSEGIRVKDSLKGVYSNKPRTAENFVAMQAGIPETKFRFYVYKDIPAGKITVAERVVKDNLRYDEELNLMDWQIEDETGEFLGYKVQKATTHFAGRDYEAWFTPELPFSDGPYKFNGLPGLIVKIKDTKLHYCFELQSFYKLGKPVASSFSPDDYIYASREQFENAKHEFERDPYAAAEKVGIKILSSGESSNSSKYRKYKQLRSNNNPLELQ